MKKTTRGVKRRSMFDVVVTILLSLYALIIFYPFYNAILTSIVSAKTALRTPAMLYPKEIDLSSYAFILKNAYLVSGYKSTIKITLLGTLYALSVSVMMAYALSRKAFPGKKTIFFMMLFTMYFGGGMIPTYLLLKDIGLMNTHAAIIFMIGISPYNIIIIKSSFEQIPSELEEAAAIDGANDLTTFFRIMLPLQKPILATFALFIAVAYWNEWFWSMITLKKAKDFTLQLVLRSIIVDATSDIEITSTAASSEVHSDGVKMAAVIATMLPIMLVYPFLQKYFVKGVMVGAIKM